MSQEEQEATSKQRTAIAKLCLSLGIRDSLETGTMTMAQAGKQIRHLSDQLRLRKLRGPKLTTTFSREFRRRLR